MAGNESNEPGHEIPDVNACTNFGRGHQTHWIMWKQYQDRTEPGRVLGFEQDLVVVQLSDGTVRRWWHHQPERLRVVVERFGPDVRVVPDLPALAVTLAASLVFLSLAYLVFKRAERTFADVI